MKTLFGWLVGLLGVVGIAACIAAVVFIFVYADDVSDTSTGTLQSVDESLTFVNERFQVANSAVGKLKTRVDDTGAFITRHIQNRPKYVGGDPKLDAAEKELSQYFETALTTLETVADAANTLAKWIVLLENLPMGGSDDLSKAASVFGDADQLAKNLRELSSLLQNLRNRIAEVKKGADSKKLATAVEDIVSQLSENLANVQSRINAYQNRLGEIDGDVNELQERIPRWINTGKYCAAAVLIWMALGQFCLFLRGCAMARRRED